MVFYAPLAKDIIDKAGGKVMTQTGTITFQTYCGIQCAYFDGSSYLVGDWSEITGASPCTLSAWLYSENFGYSPAFNIGSPSVHHWRMIGLTTDEGNIYASLFSTTDGDLKSSASGAYAWHHILATFDSAVTTLYIDGVQSGTLAIVPETTTGYIAIGRDTNGNSANTVGYIASCRVFSRILTAEEIAALYAEHSGDITF